MPHDAPLEESRWTGCSPRCGGRRPVRLWPWFAPLAEVAAGLLLLVGLFARLAALVGMAMMIVASYMHLTVHDPALFPLQPESPIIPIIALILLAWILRAGGGSGSLGLRRQERSAPAREQKEKRDE